MARDLARSDAVILTDLLDGGDDVGVGAAAADVATHRFLHVGVGRPAGFFEQSDGRHDLAGRTVSTLVAVARDERRLHRVEGARRTEALDRRDLVPVARQGERQARVHAPTVDVYGAGTALPVVTALLGAGEGDGLADAVEERGARVDAERVRLAVDL